MLNILAYISLVILSIAILYMIYEEIIKPVLAIKEILNHLGLEFIEKEEEKKPLLRKKKPLTSQSTLTSNHADKTGSVTGK